MKGAALWFVVLAGCTTHRNNRDLAAQYEHVRQLLQKGEFDSAGQTAGRAAGEARRRGSAEWVVAFEVFEAERLLAMDRRDDALRRLERIKAPAERPDLVARLDATLAAGICGGAYGMDPGRAAEQFRHADELLEAGSRAAENAGPELRGEVEHRRAGCFSRKQDLDAAEEADQNVVKLARANGLRFLEGSALVNLSYFAWRTRHYEQGAAYARDSLDIARELGSNYLLVKALGNAGLCYSSLGDYDSALEYLKLGETIVLQQGLREDARILLQNLGNVNYFLKNYSAAVEYYKRALPFAAEKKAMAQLLANLSAVATERRDFDTAEIYNADALRLKRELSEPDSTGSLKRSEVLNARILLGKGNLHDSQTEFLRLAKADLVPEDVLVDSHAGLAEIYRRWGRKQESKREYQAAIGIVENSRNALQLDESKITFLTGVWELYDNYIRLLAEDGRVAEALAAADRSRAATLSQRIEQPRVHGHKLAMDSRAMARSTRAVLLSYWLAGEQSYLWVSTSSRVEQFKLPARKLIEDLVEKYQRIVEKPRDALRGDGAELGVGLWNHLIAPAAKLIPAGSRVIVVPDRGLHRLNFETLIAPAPIQHYWIDDVTILETPALRALHADNSPARQGDSILLMGDPTQSGSEFPELNHANEEIEGIEQYYTAADRVVLTRSAATPAAYLDSDPRHFRFIHLAAHATANRVRPLDSAVVLAKARGEYKLFARDVLKTPLSADLVTISGCHSAGGQTYAGEGLVGFSWAFLRAGARNVIAGLWNVDDRSTSKLMVELHRELRLGRAPDEALREAKLSLKQNGVYRRPFYWASFLLYTRDGSAGTEPSR